MDNVGLRIILLSVPLLFMTACDDGRDGADGTQGADGLSSLILLTEVAAGPDCINGGTLVQTGIDANRNEVLDEGEIDASSFICRPEPADQFDGLIYVADAQFQGMNQLYAASRDGGPVTKLAGPPKVGMTISLSESTAPSLSPDRSKLAFVLNTGTESELFVIDLLAKQPTVQVSGPMVENGKIRSYYWSPNSDRLLYRADQDAENAIDLYLVLADGTAQRKITTRALGGVTWSPDGEWLTYISDKVTANEQELYRNTSMGNAELMLSAPLQDDDDALAFQQAVKWAPDGSQLAYLARTAPEYIDRIFTVKPDGSDHQEASDPTIIDAGDVLRTFAWAPDSSRIAYIADASQDGVFGLYSALPDGTAHHTLADRITTDSSLVSTGDPTMFAWAPDSSAVAFVSDRLEANVFELFVASANGANINRVSGTMVQNGDIGGLNNNLSDPLFAWSPDSSLLAFRADRLINNVTQLFIVERNSDDPIQVSLNSDTFQNVADFAWSPDGAWLAYVSPDDINFAPELYAVDPQLTERWKLSTPAASANEKVFGPIRWSPDGDRLAYRADRDPTGSSTVELFTVGLDGSSPIKVSGELVTNGDVSDFFWE